MNGGLVPTNALDSCGVWCWLVACGLWLGLVASSMTAWMGGPRPHWLVADPCAGKGNLLGTCVQRTTWRVGKALRPFSEEEYGAIIGLSKNSRG